MNAFGIIAIYPIGTKLRMINDNADTIHDVYGYEWFGDIGNIIFRDGSKLSMRRLELISEVVT